MVRREVIVGGRIIGWTQEHFFFTNRKPGGRGEGHTYIDHETRERCYCISDKALRILKEQGVRQVQVVEWHKDIEARRRALAASIDEWLEANLIQHEPFEEQRALPIRRMEVVRNYRTPREAIPEEVREAYLEQMEVVA
jgi:hypothetical protein